MLCRLLLIVQTNVHVRYFAVFCITSGTYTTIGLILAWCRYLRFIVKERSSKYIIQMHIILDLRLRRPLGFLCSWRLGNVGASLGLIFILALKVLVICGYSRTRTFLLISDLNLSKGFAGKTQISISFEEVFEPRIRVGRKPHPYGGK